ncbi:MAG: response regulator [Planctomycetales bacterium]|nr:response regulator [Planctomycetales bacterium]
MGVKVFIVEDNNTLRESLGAWLQSTDIQATLFDNGTAALEAALGDCDLIVVDATLPDISGVDLIGELRHRGHNMPIILSSGFPHYREHVPTNGVFLQKPYKPEVLIELIHLLLDHGN